MSIINLNHVATNIDHELHRGRCEVRDGGLYFDDLAAEELDFAAGAAEALKEELDATQAELEEAHKDRRAYEEEAEMFRDLYTVAGDLLDELVDLVKELAQDGPIDDDSTEDGEIAELARNIVERWNKTSRLT